jgi:hypothetical protein
MVDFNTKHACKKIKNNSLKNFQKYKIFLLMKQADRTEKISSGKKFQFIPVFCLYRVLRISVPNFWILFHELF